MDCKNKKDLEKIMKPCLKQLTQSKTENRLGRTAMDKNRKQKEECEHDWKAVGETHMKTHVKFLCVKCGKEKEIEQCPF